MKRFLLVALLAGGCHARPATPAPPPPPADTSPGMKATDVAPFKRLTKASRMEDVKHAAGAPDGDVGSGIHIYVWKFSDGGSVRVGTMDNDQVFYIDWKKPDGTTERLVGAKH